MLNKTQRNTLKVQLLQLSTEFKRDTLTTLGSIILYGEIDDLGEDEYQVGLYAADLYLRGLKSTAIIQELTKEFRPAWTFAHWGDGYSVRLT